MLRMGGRTEDGKTVGGAEGGGRLPKKVILQKRGLTCHQNIYSFKRPDGRLILSFKGQRRCFSAVNLPPLAPISSPICVSQFRVLMFPLLVPVSNSYQRGSLSEAFYNIFREKLSQVPYKMFSHADVCKSWWSNRLGFIYRC